MISQTVRTFLDSMIAQRRGHIVGISSLGGKITFPLAVGYSATKFGVRGFMGALYDELCTEDHDEFVKLTTVYPAFINTRKELSDLLDKSKETAPRMSPGYAANAIVKGILENKSDVTLPEFAGFAQIIQ